MSLHDILSGEGVRTAIVFMAFAQQWEAHYFEFLWGRRYLLVFHWDVRLHLETTTKHKVDKKNFECFQNLAPMSLLDSAHQNNSQACDRTV